MEFSASQVLQILVTVVGIAVAWGALGAKVAHLREQLRELQATRERQGERLGLVERDVAIIKAMGRRPTRLGVPAIDLPADKDSGE